MFGAYRYLLACLVMLTHLAAWPGAGSYAVFGFYTLSGFLMALVLHERYGLHPAGLVRYAGNRALRIYPPYLAVLLLALLLVRYAPERAREFWPVLTLPESSGAWLGNLLIFGIGWQGPSRLIPPSWSLEAELFYYAAMALLLVRHRAVALLWLVASVAYTATLLVIDVDWSFRYYPIAAASLPFSLGANLYLHRDRVRFVAPRAAPVLLIVFVVHALLCHRWGWYFRTWGFYASLGLAVLLVGGLFATRSFEIPPRLRRLDRILGNLSYPIFLCHLPAGLAVELLPVPGGSITRFLASVAVTHVAAVALHAAVERPVRRLRDRIRSSASGPGRRQFG